MSTNIERYWKIISNASSASDLLKIRKEIEHLAKTQGENTLLYYLTVRLDRFGVDTTDLQLFFIEEVNNPYHLLNLALYCRIKNVPLIQSKLIQFRNIDYIAQFGARVKGADIELIEQILVDRKNPRSIYIYIDNNKRCDVHKFKEIILKSKKPRYLYALAKHISNQQELDAIQELILKGKSLLYVRLFGTYIAGADLDRCISRIVETGDMDEIKKFWRICKHPRLESYMLLM